MLHKYLRGTPRFRVRASAGIGIGATRDITLRSGQNLAQCYCSVIVARFSVTVVLLWLGSVLL